MKNKKGFALIVSLVLVIGVVLPGTLALSTDQAATNGEITALASRRSQGGSMTRAYPHPLPICTIPARAKQKSTTA